MPTARLEQMLSGCPLFHEMTLPERHEIFGLLERQTFPPGAEIIAENDSRQHMYFLLSGRCQVLKAKAGGSEQELSILEPCGVFGEMSFFQPAPHSATVRAQTEVEVAKLARDRYDMLLRVGSHAALKLAFNTVGVLAERLRRMDSWICDLLDKFDAADHHEEWRDFQKKLYSDWKF